MCICECMYAYIYKWDRLMAWTHSLLRRCDDILIYNVSHKFESIPDPFGKGSMKTMAIFIFKPHKWERLHWLYPLSDEPSAYSIIPGPPGAPSLWVHLYKKRQEWKYGNGVRGGGPTWRSRCTGQHVHGCIHPVHDIFLAEIALDRTCRQSWVVMREKDKKGNGGAIDLYFITQTHAM